VDSAAERVFGLNPDVRVEKHPIRLNKSNVYETIRGYDVIVDGVDNFASRYLLHDACYFQKKPFVEAGVLQFLGQVMVILPGEGPCYRCLFPEPPPPGTVPSCQEAGILGAVAGVLGVLQATEAIKLITGIGKPLCGRLIIYEALSGSFREVGFKRNARCPLCGDSPIIKGLVEYPLDCSREG